MVVDFSELRKITPVGMSLLAALKARGRVEFDGLAQCSILPYLQRMDFLRLCGIDEFEESFSRHPAAGKFVPLEEIGIDVLGTGSRVAGCLAPGGEDFDHELADLYDFCWYVFTELGNNVRQHGIRVNLRARLRAHPATSGS
ncbi:MAG: hypothetical protein P1U81_13745, partial [Verrucomicrobiales bacterium]|nr:hypothetical protein [Verrucomicrobiales bacterium]